MNKGRIRVLLTREPVDGIGTVVDPLWRMRADVSLRSCIGHWVVTDPCSQIDVESIGVDNPMCIHQPVAGELEKEKQVQRHDGIKKHRIATFIRCR